MSGDQRDSEAIPFLPFRAYQVALALKNLPANAGDLRDVIRGSGRPPGRGHGKPLQYYFLENPKGRGA